MVNQTTLNQNALDQGLENSAGVGYRVNTRANNAAAIALQDVDFHVAQPRNYEDPRLPEIYRVWSSGWRRTLAEVAPGQAMTSDAFTRQDRVGAFFSRDRCIALTGLRWVDRSLEQGRDDSYFQDWPADALEVLGESRICISSNTLIDEAWRGVKLLASGQTVPLKLLTIGLSAKGFVDSTADYFVGVARNDKSMQHVGLALGAKRLGRLRVHGILSDIVYGHRSDVPDLGPLVEYLWQRRVIEPDDLTQRLR